jgi:CheY-like chemotaxis protein
MMGAPRQVVLLVEDAQDVRGLFVLALRSVGCEVWCAADGLEALRLIETKRPDVVVIDLHFPYISGRDVLAVLEAHAATRSIPVVAVTGPDQRVFSRNRLCQLRKPVTTDRLIEAVTNCSPR